MSVHLGEPWPAWHPSVRWGVWVNERVETQVLAVLAPQDPGAVGHAIRTAEPVLAMRGSHILPLLAVVPVGGLLAWLYPAEVVIAASEIPPEGLGHRAVAEVVLETARAIRGQDHPGPAPSHVLLDARGWVRVANFVGPLEAPEGFRPPGRGTGEQDRVYRLGALLAFLLGSELPSVERAADHDAGVRRVLINAMSLPGAVFPDGMREVLRDTLAWDPRDRPSLDQLIARLDAEVQEGAGAALAESMISAFPRWMGRFRNDPLHTYTPSGDDLPRDFTEVGHATLNNDDSDLPVEDEPTVDSELGIVNDRTPTSVIEFGSLPLEVGPPPEAFGGRRPSLPEGFMGSSETTQVASVPPPRWVRPVVLLLLIAMIALALTLFLT